VTYLFEGESLPPGFKFPASFLRMMEQSPPPDFDPWWFLLEYPERARFWLRQLPLDYPTRILVPFAKFGPYDDIACFDGADQTGNPAVFYVHVGASPGWEDRGGAPDFEGWVEHAKRDAKEHAQAEEEESEFPDGGSIKDG
jgi:hypothetical protein